MKYLNDYRKDFDLDRFINYGSKVTQLSVLSQHESRLKVGDEKLPKIRLEWQTNGEAGTKSEVFDAVCIANGHYAQPSFPDLEGMGNFRGKTIHSIEYDNPECFAGETVLCIGGRASGADVAREISQHASHVYLSDSTADTAETQGSVTCVPRAVSVDADGCCSFANDCSVRPKVDTIIFCTGYDYQFPFINDESNLELSVTPGERRIMPLYKQLWHADLPNLSFIGLPHSVLPFPLFELQVEAFVQQILLGGNELPGRTERREKAQVDAVTGGSSKNGRVKDTHHLGSAQWDYCRELAQIAHVYDDDMEQYIATNRVSFQQRLPYMMWNCRHVNSYILVVF